MSTRSFTADENQLQDSIFQKLFFGFSLVLFLSLVSSAIELALDLIFNLFCLCPHAIT